MGLVDIPPDPVSAGRVSVRLQLDAAEAAVTIDTLKAALARRVVGWEGGGRGREFAGVCACSTATINIMAAALARRVVAGHRSKCLQMGVLCSQGGTRLSSILVALMEDVVTPASQNKLVPRCG